MTEHVAFRRLWLEMLRFLKSAFFLFTQNNVLSITLRIYMFIVYYILCFFHIEVKYVQFEASAANKHTSHIAIHHIRRLTAVSVVRILVYSICQMEITVI